MTTTASVLELVIPGFVAALASLFSDGVVKVVFGLSVAAFCFRGARAERDRPLLALVLLVVGVLALYATFT